MEARGRTFWEMEKEAVSYVLKNESVWSHLAVIVTNVTLLEQNERDLDAAYKAQDASDPGGYTDQKNMMLNLFYHKIYKLSCKLSFYGKNVGDKILLNDVNIAESSFNKVTEKEALIQCNTIIKRGNEYLSRTAEYGVTADGLKSLGSELAILEQMKPTIGVITNDHKSATRSIKDIISEARVQLDKLDDAFEGMLDDDDFIDGWFAVRKIKGRHKPKGPITTKPASE